MITPAFPQAPHLRNPTGEIAVWYTEPAGVVLQIMQEGVGTLALAQWLAGPSLDELNRRFPDRDDLIVIFDVRPLTSRDSAARSAIIELAKQLKGHIKRVIVLPPRHFGPTLLRTMEVTLAVLRVFGVHVEIARSLNTTIASAGLQPLPK